MNFIKEVGNIALIFHIKKKDNVDQIETLLDQQYQIQPKMQLTRDILGNYWGIPQYPKIMDYNSHNEETY